MMMEKMLRAIRATGTELGASVSEWTISHNDGATRWVARTLDFRSGVSWAALSVFSKGLLEGITEGQVGRLFFGVHMIPANI